LTVEAVIEEPEVTSASEFLQKHKKSHCPFGCKDHQTDEYGYCFHLLGFTNDKQTFEPVKPLIRLDKDRVPYDTGYQTVLGGKKIQKVADLNPRFEVRFVNPERTVVDRGIVSQVKAWVSDRVYQNIPEPPEREPLSAPNPADDELYALAQRKRVLEEKLSRKRLEDEIAAMERELGQVEDPDDDDDDPALTRRTDLATK
jgi:hypothetical protein